MVVAICAAGWLALLPGSVRAQPVAQIATPVVSTGDPAITRQPLTLKLDDGFTTKAEIDAPAAAGSGPFPAVLLLGGSGQTDMNGAGPSAAGFPAFENYREMLDNLVRRGFIVYKFNKRGLDTGGQIVDQAQSDRRTNDVLVQDASAALRQFLAEPRVDKQKVFLLGHSQGTLIAAQVARKFPGQLKGLVLTGTITNWNTAFDYQLVGRFIEVANEADTNHDGQLTPAELTAVLKSDLANFTNFRELQLLEAAVMPFFSQPAPGEVGPFKSDAQIDKNADGQLSIEGELRPVLQSQRATFLNQPDILKNSGESGAALKSLQDGPQLEQILLPLGLPVFLQHSLEDERFPVGQVQALAAELNAANVPAALNIYPGVTHSFVPGSLLYSLLNNTGSTTLGQVVPQQILDDQTSWLLNRLKPSPATPPANPQAGLPVMHGLFNFTDLVAKLLLKH
jgi:pimeloyl-ACP methyl ester carboxylesterase